VLVSDLVPASSTDWQLPIIVVDVELNVTARAFSVPRVFAVFSNAFHKISPWKRFQMLEDLKQSMRHQSV
jgi:hypothetical protein